MGNYSPVYSQAQTLQVIDQVRYLQRPLLTFTAEDPTFLAAFQASATVTNSKGQTIDTGGLVRELDVNTYLGYFEGAQAPLTEPIRAAVTALFSARGYADANGIRRPAVLPDKVYIGLRTTADVTSYLYTVTGAFDGTYTLSVGIFGVGVKTFTFVASGNTATEIRDGLLALALADPDVVAVATLAPNGVDAIDADTNAAGVPLIISGTSTGSPVTVVEDTLAGTWDADFDAMVKAAETDGAQERLWYWVHDIQCNDAVNLDAAAHIKDLADPGVTPVPTKYRYRAQTHDPLNFDPLSAGASFVEQLLALGYDRTDAGHKALPEYFQAAWIGRCVGYFPGQISFAVKELFGNTAVGQMSKEDYGANELLINTRRFNYYSGTSVNGTTATALVPAQGRWIETGWLEDYVEVVFNQGIVDYLALNDIVTYTDDDIKALRAAGEQALFAVPLGIIAIDSSIKLRNEVDPQDIVQRRYVDLVLNITTSGRIIQVGTPDKPVPLLIQEF